MLYKQSQYVRVNNDGKAGDNQHMLLDIVIIYVCNIIECYNLIVLTYIMMVGLIKKKL